LTQIDDQAAAYDAPLIGALLRLPWETVRKRMLEGLHERGFDDISAAHLVILQYPGPNGLRPSELAERSRMSKQAVNYLLGQMERLGYIARREHAGSARFKYIELTERGVEAVRVKREIVLAVEADWERTLGPERFALLREMLIELQSDDERPVDATTSAGWTDGGTRRLVAAPR
jgi:DNA-binding MarR family transcriptional regulator